MSKIDILYLHSLMFYGRSWQRTAEILRDYGITLRFAEQRNGLEALAQQPDILVAELNAGSPDYAAILEQGSSVSHRLGISTEIPGSFSNFAKMEYWKSISL